MTRTMPGWVLRRTALLSWGGSVLVIVENDARNDAGTMPERRPVGDLRRSAK